MRYWLGVLLVVTSCNDGSGVDLSWLPFANGNRYACTVKNLDGDVTDQLDVCSSYEPTTIIKKLSEQGYGPLLRCEAAAALAPCRCSHTLCID